MTWFEFSEIGFLTLDSFLGFYLDLDFNLDSDLDLELDLDLDLDLDFDLDWPGSESEVSKMVWHSFVGALEVLLEFMVGGVVLPILVSTQVQFWTLDSGIWISTGLSLDN